MSQQDRPASLRRTPRPARDESVDPIDTRPAPPATPAQAAPSVSTRPEQTPDAGSADAPSTATAPATSTAPPASTTPAAAAPRGRRRAEPTVPFSSRIAPEIDDLLHEAVASGRAATIRAALEEAIRKTWG